MGLKTKTNQPRCYLVYALAPKELGAAQANELFNEFVADKSLPLAVFHDHFIGHPGGVALFSITTPEERDALLESRHLNEWQVDFLPLIFSRNPAAFDEQIAFTLKAYRGTDWEQLQKEDRPVYGNPMAEARSASEGDEQVENA